MQSVLQIIVRKRLYAVSFTLGLYLNDWQTDDFN